MRRVRADVSHRIRRQPSIFSTAWFRSLLGIGLVMIVALLVGPSLAGWFGSEVPRSLLPLLPWSGGVGAPETVEVASPASPPPSVAGDGVSGAAARHAAVEGAARLPAGSARDATAAVREPAAGSGSDTTARPASGTTASAAPAPAKEAGAARPLPAAAPATTTQSPRLTAPPSVYWVQVGAFLDHRNADRLAERLRSEGHSVGLVDFEQSRVRYRVLLSSASGASAGEDVLERVRTLGHVVESTPDGPAVEGLVPLRRAVEISQELRREGVPVRLKQIVSSATYRVVRVGSFTSSAEADAALASLTARGLEGVVVRER